MQETQAAFNPTTEMLIGYMSACTYLCIFNCRPWLVVNKE